MTYDVEIGGTRRQVTVQREGPMLRVTIDGRARLVDATRVGDAIWSLRVGEDAASAVSSLDVALTPHRAAGGFDVHIDGRATAVQIRPAGAFGRQGRDGAGAQGTGPQRILSPMPGKVVRILAAPGDEVKAKQGLVVVEAMKMENELRAARDGRVREVAVSQGQSVEAGAVLMIVE